MKWRIRERSYGGYVVERGLDHKGGAPSVSGIGYSLPAFIVYESISFDTLAQAERYLKKVRRG